MSALSTSPVWFIAAGNQEGSAVLVWVRPIGSKVSELRLVTAQHLLRQNKAPAGTYAIAIQGWLPGDGFNPATAVPLAIDTVLTPPENLPMAGSEDFAFLTLAPGFTGIPSPLLADALCQPVLNNITLSGYPGGAAFNAVHRGVVTPVVYAQCTFVDYLVAIASGILNPGLGAPVAGVSGGGVFSEGRYAGVYRGEFTAVGQHTFIPVNVLRQWCLSHGYELVDLPVTEQVTSIQESLDVTVAMVTAEGTNAGIKSITDPARQKLGDLKSLLDEFLVYKLLHDSLHLVQLQFASMASAVRSTPLVDLGLFELALDGIESILPGAISLINSYLSPPRTFKTTEGRWVEALDAAIKMGREAADEDTAKAVSACMQIRSILRTHLPRINVALVEAARSMDLGLLSTLFRNISLLPGLPAAVAENYKQSAAVSLTLSQGLQQQIQVHDLWQTIDVTLWDAEQLLPAAPGSPRQLFELQWAWTTDNVQQMMLAANATGTTVWTSKVSPLLLSLTALLPGQDYSRLPRSFDLFAQAVRRQFYQVDKELKKLAEQVADLGKRLDPLT